MGEADAGTVREAGEDHGGGLGAPEPELIYRSANCGADGPPNKARDKIRPKRANAGALRAKVYPEHGADEQAEHCSGEHVHLAVVV